MKWDCFDSWKRLSPPGHAVSLAPWGHPTQAKSRVEWGTVSDVGLGTLFPHTA
jgi:hypothetical protein